MYRKIFPVILVILTLTGIGRADGSDGFWACPPEVAGQTLRVYQWTTYIAEDTVSNFEALCHVSVLYNTFVDEADMTDALRAGNPDGYDVVVPIDSTMYLLLAENLLQPLTYANIPNFINISQGFKDRAATFDPGNEYSVPYLWGTTGIGYNRTRIGRDLTGFQEFFQSPDIRVAWINAPRLMLGIALNMLGLNPSSDNPADLEQAKNYLIANSQNLTVIADDTGQDLLADGQVDAVIEYSGDVFQIIGQCRCNDFVYIVPVEGTVTDMTSLAVPRNAANPYLGEIFIDYLLDKQVAADIANYTVYGTPNQVAIDEALIYEEYLTDPAIYPPDEVMAKMFLLVSNDSIEQLFNDTWEATRAALGK